MSHKLAPSHIKGPLTLWHKRVYCSGVRKHHIPPASRKYCLARRRSVPADGSDLRVKTSRVSSREEGEWISWKPGQFSQTETLSHGRCNCAVMMAKCCQNPGHTEKPHLTFQPDQSDGIIVGSDEDGAPERGKSKRWGNFPGIENL